MMLPDLPSAELEPCSPKGHDFLPVTLLFVYLSSGMG